jgi:hypothetical protein
VRLGLKITDFKFATSKKKKDKKEAESGEISGIILATSEEDVMSVARSLVLT